MLGQQLNINSITAYSKSLRYFFLGYIAYLLSHYIAPKAIYSSLIFYLAVIAPLACHLYHYRKDLIYALGTNKLLVFLLLYILLHSIIMIPEMKADLALKGIRNVFATFMFLLASLMFFHKADDKLKNNLFTVLTITCGVMALSSILLHVFANYDGRVRMIPLGFARHEILGASVYAVSGLIALYMFFKAEIFKHKILYLIVYLLVLAVVIMTFSRGPILAYIASTGLALLLFTPYYKKIIVFSALSVISIIAVLLIMPKYLEIVISYMSPLLERGTSYRLELWQLTIDRIIEQPLLGYGIRNVFISDVPGGYSPHNLYLATAYYFGMPALIILLGVITQAAARALKGLQTKNYNSLILLLLIHALFSVITDHGQLARGNTPIWIIFWMPICMCLSYKQDKENK